MGAEVASGPSFMNLLEVVITAVRNGEIAPPPGSGPDEFVQWLSVHAPTPAEWTGLLRAWKDRNILSDAMGVLADQETSHRNLLSEHRDSVAHVDNRLAKLESVIYPLFSTPDSPPTQGWEWRNLWAFWQFVPGTLAARLLLTLWTFKDWWIIGAVMFALGSIVPWQGLSALGALGILSVVLFVIHEVLFRWWGQRVCKLEETDPHEYSMKFTPTFERFVSRYMR